MKHIVSVDWLYEQLGDPNVRIIDCRFQLGQPLAGFEEYMEEHIPGSLYFDLEKDLSGKVTTHGGRHPLPDFDRFVDKISTAGIDKNTTVVIYDGQGGMIASRLWWMLTYLGHKNVYVLNGGIQNWLSQGYPVTIDIPVHDKKEFTPTLQKHLLSDIEEVKMHSENQSAVLLDSRDQNRYAGIEEPVDKAAGHIPSARNKFWKDCITDQGKWKSGKELAEQFMDLKKDEEVIVYCGSGVSACPNILALTDLGFENVKLYVGSWSDWISYEDNLIEK